tara:strand:+ start:34782 stop:35243 length:462 start_codon:yes stop_codon:yes gene_type:complete
MTNIVTQNKTGIISTLKALGPQSAGQLAELMGEDAETVKVLLDELLKTGPVIKNGRYRYQLPAGYSLTDKPEATEAPQTPAKPLSVCKPVKQLPDSEPAQGTTVLDMIAHIEQRLNRPSIDQLDEKRAALHELARVTGIRLLDEIAADLERAA